MLMSSGFAESLEPIMGYTHAEALSAYSPLDALLIQPPAIRVQPVFPEAYRPRCSRPKGMISRKGLRAECVVALGPNHWLNAAHEQPR
jgi:hypothetical protein